MSSDRRFRARVTVFPRPEILDPQGKALGQSLVRIGYGEVKEVRAGKTFRIDLDCDDRSDAETRVEEMCRKLLANPIVEDFTFELEEMS